MNAEKYLLSIPSKQIKYDLTRTLRLLKACKNPEKEILSIQIVGTNGKGSVSAFLAKILDDGGYKVGLYTSPHLVNLKERIRINFKMISEKTIQSFLNQYKLKIAKIKPSFFELMTVLAIWHFRQQKVDIAILETGLGGRLDSVTACKNDYILFTSISLDHEDILGPTLSKIAKEKGGAITNNQQTCIGVNQPRIIREVLIAEARRADNRINFLPKSFNPLKEYNFKYLKGEHQYLNASLAYAAIERLAQEKIITIDKKNIIQSLKLTTWPGRFQIISKKPTIIYDVAHNREGLESFIKTFKNIKYKKRKILILGFENNKKITETLQRLDYLFDCIICTETGVRKSMPAEDIYNLLNNKKSIIIKDVNSALQYALNQSDTNTIISIIGSHFFAPYINNNYQNCFAINK